MADAINAVQGTADNVIQAEPGYSILHGIEKRRVDVLSLVCGQQPYKGVILIIHLSRHHRMQIRAISDIQPGTVCSRDKHSTNASSDGRQVFRRPQLSGAGRT